MKSVNNNFIHDKNHVQHVSKTLPKRYKRMNNSYKWKYCTKGGMGKQLLFLLGSTV